MPVATSETLRWNGPEVAKFMARKKIQDRADLAKRINKPGNTVRRTFDDTWEGDATGPVAVAICRTLGADFRKLIRDPRYC